MSYCRFLDGDAYIYGDMDGGIVCCGCRLNGGPMNNFTADGPMEMLAHVEEHQAAGHDIPRHTVDRLEHEALTELVQEGRQ